MNNEVSKNLHEDDIVDWMNCDEEALMVCQMMDEKITTVRYPTEGIDDDIDSDSEEPQETRMDQGIKQGDHYVSSGSRRVSSPSKK